METKIISGVMHVNIPDLIESLDDDGRNDIIEQLSCHDAILERVCQQIVTGWTEAGSHGGRGYSHTPFTPLDKAIRAISDASSEIAQKEIQKLANGFRLAEESRDKAWTTAREWEDKYYSERGMR